jgi:hypothetical protein
MNWQEQVQIYMDKFKGNPWDPYAPQAKQGFLELATHENLACVLCVNLVKAISFTPEGKIVVNTDGTLDIGCDFDMGSGYRKVSIIPDSNVTGGARVGKNSEHGCRRGLLSR